MPQVNIKIYHPEEMVDVFDTQGNIAATVTKSQAHIDGFRHKTSIGEVIDSKGRWMLVIQSGSKQDPGQYVSAIGGHVPAGKTPEEALVMEAEEELGFKGFDFKYKGEFDYNRQVIGRKENHVFVIFEVYCDQEPILNHESVEYKRFTPKELRTEIKQHPELFGAPFIELLKRFYPEIIK